MTDITDGIIAVIKEFGTLIGVITTLIVAITAYKNGNEAKKQIKKNSAEIEKKSAELTKKTDEISDKLDTHVENVTQSLRESAAINGPFADRRHSDQPVVMERRRTK